MSGNDRTALSAGQDWDPVPPRAFGPVDQVCCYYDHPAEPASVYLEARLPGQLDQTALRLAVWHALAAEPLARGRRATGTPLHSSYTWQFPRQPDTDPVSVTSWASEEELATRRLAFLAAPPSLDRCPPVRLLLAAGPAHDCLLLSAHHAALDGQSCLDLLRRISAQLTVAQRAGSAVAQVSPAAAASAPAVPARAQRPARPGRAARPWYTARLRHAARLARELARRPARIAADASGRRQPGYGLQLLTVSPVPVPPRRPGEDPATVNDLLIAALILAVARWNAAHGQPGRPVRVSMPVGSRPPGRAAGNLGRTCTVSAWPGPEPSDRDRLLTEVARQTMQAKAHPGAQLGAFSRGLATARLPAAVKRRLVRATLATVGPALCDTTMLSNLGNVADPPRFGLDGPAEDRVALAFSPPAHMPRGLSVGAVTVGGRLELAFRYRYALLGDAAAARFAAGYRGALAELVSGDQAEAGLSGHGQRRDSQAGP